MNNRHAEVTISKYIQDQIGQMSKSMTNKIDNLFNSSEHLVHLYFSDVNHTFSNHAYNPHNFSRFQHELHVFCNQQQGHYGYISDIGDILDNVQDIPGMVTIIGTISTALTSAKNTIDTILTQANKVTGLGDKLSSLLGTVGTITRDISRLPTNIKTALLDTFNLIQTTLTGIGENISGVWFKVQNVGNTIGTQLTGLPASVSSAVSGAINSAIQDIVNRVATIYNTLSNIGASIGMKLNQVSSTISGLATTISSSITNQISNLNIPSLNDITSAIPSVSDITSAIPSIDDIKGAIPSLESLTAKITDAFQSAIKNLVDNVLFHSYHGYSKVRHAFKTGISNVSHSYSGHYAIGDLGQKLTDFFGGAGNIMTKDLPDFLLNMPEKVSQGWSSLGTGLGSLGSALSTGIGTVGTNLGNVGESIKSGFETGMSGLSSGIGTVGTNLGNVGESIKGGFETGLGNLSAGIENAGQKLSEAGQFMKDGFLFIANGIKEGAIESAKLTQGALGSGLGALSNGLSQLGVMMSAGLTEAAGIFADTLKQLVSPLSSFLVPKIKRGLIWGGGIAAALSGISIGLAIFGTRKGYTGKALRLAAGIPF